MNIITEPTVHVLAVPSFMAHPEYVLPKGESTHSEYLIAHAGKGCYDSYGIDGRSIEDHIHTLIDSKHGSVLEHAVVSLFITGISRGCSHEIVRHRPFAFSQRSTRYTNETDANIVLEPFYAWVYKEHIPNCNRNVTSCNYCYLYDYFITGCFNALDKYATLVFTLMKIIDDPTSPGIPDTTTMTKTDKRKWARGKARQILPHALETRMTMTGNLRAWRWFIETRSHPASEPEIRRLTQYIFEALAPLAPLVFKDFSAIPVNGYPHYIADNSKI